MAFKTIAAGDAGDSTHFGGNDMNKVMSQLNGTDNDVVKLPVDYVDFNLITAPSSPSSGYIRMFMDSADSKIKIKRSDGTIVIIE
jgi:hypothetical protein